MPREIRLYSRSGCHLCEQAVEHLEHIAALVALHVTEINILDDPKLYERYKHSIPVIEIADGPTLNAPIDEQELRQALGAA
ncbi:MAG: glutaredoxin family protein [Chloroflexales bacterium]|nr:glutaredoxin family protein [Chloroflexales bacterium]